MQTLAHEPQVLQQGLLSLNAVLEEMTVFQRFMDPPGGSLLLRELADAQGTCADPTLHASATPLLHRLSAVHSFVCMFTHVCKASQTEIRTMSVTHWGSDLGQDVMANLSRLYLSLVWESTILLALCSDDVLPDECNFGT